MAIILLLIVQTRCGPENKMRFETQSYPHHTADQEETTIILLPS